MHPYVKHHKSTRVLAVVYLLSIMGLHQPVSSNDTSCNFTVKKLRIHSQYSKGYLRVEGNQIVANDTNSTNMEKFYLYTITIDRHYMLLYHIGSRKFICWNKNYTRLVAKRNPANLSFCKFEEKTSLLDKYSVRYTARNAKGLEIEIRINKRGTFMSWRRLARCLERKNVEGERTKSLDELDLTQVIGNETQRLKYISLRKCMNPDFMVIHENCSKAYLPDFCNKMKVLRNHGHSISPEIIQLCKNEWRRSNY